MVAGLVTLGGVAALLITSAPLSVYRSQKQARLTPRWRLQRHRFRGPDGGGVSVFTNIPTEWDGATGKGILWKTAVPLPGNNSPVIWNDRIFLCGATEQKQEVYCYDANAGRLLWTGDVPVFRGDTGENRSDGGHRPFGLDHGD